LSRRFIQLRGVEVHNLKKVDLDIPHQKLVVFCGVSGSGKTSLALDTLYAEGQRRYIESFSTYTRQFLQRLEKPAAERIEGIPPAIAVTHRHTSPSSRSTVGTVTETIDYVRLLYAKIGQVVCQGCGRPVRRDTPESSAEALGGLAESTRFMVTFPHEVAAGQDARAIASTLQEDGFVRAVVRDRVIQFADDEWNMPPPGSEPDGEIFVVVDRLTAGTATPGRVRDSLETAFRKGGGRCTTFVHLGGNGASPMHAAPPLRPTRGQSEYIIDGQPWRRIGFSTRLTCEDCQREYPLPEPRLYSFDSPRGACPACEGFGNIIGIDMERVVPDADKSLKEGAIAPWNTPAYAHEREELLALGDEYGVPVDVPVRQLTPEQWRIIDEGVAERNFGGLAGFFAWLERHKYKMHVRVFLSRWRSYRTCPACGGSRLRPEALATQVAGKNIAELAQMKIRDVLRELGELALTDWQRRVSRTILEQLTSRLGYLEAVGLGYLALDRSMRTLSSGEAQRVALTSALGSSLVHVLYVLDEPSVGLHASDIDRLLEAIRGIRGRGNTVVLVEHDPTMIRAAEHVVEIGPGAGEHGGQVVFEGPPEKMVDAKESLTGQYLAGRRGVTLPQERRTPSHGWIRLVGARGNNLKNVTAQFPLGVLCLVTGASGAGKSTLVEDTLYPALCQRKGKDATKPCPFDEILGDGQVDDVVLIDQTPIGRSPRSNPVTYIKAFDAIRGVFAETIEARTHNYSASHFSFNVDGGRCHECHGDGYVEVDMQFLANVYMRCSQCSGKRYRREILDVTYRGHNIAEVLDMTVRQASTFFRGQAKAQAKLKRLIDVGLDYLRLGQPANTLSTGEAQRLKLAGYLDSAKRTRTLFLLDEPTTGLHFSDVIQLLDCFDALLAAGHSLIVVEHNLQLMRAADYLIDLGPHAADQGGEIVACGTPEEVAQNTRSITGQFLSAVLAAGPCGTEYAVAR
jgi:excinuclease ABC subunit A